MRNDDEVISGRGSDHERRIERRGVDDLAIESAKILLRRAVILRRDLRAAPVRQTDDGARFELIRARLEGYRLATVAAYLSSGSEPGTLQLVAWLAAHGVRVLLPVMTSAAGDPMGEPAWARYAGPDALRVGARSILEPRTEVLAGTALSDAQLIICPALAANPLGDRLGRGGGWYDRALQGADSGAQVWALLNNDEVLDAIPTRQWDRRVTGVVTQSKVIRCHPEPTRESPRT